MRPAGDPRCRPVVALGLLEIRRRGYRDGGGDLPPDWCRTARLLDAIQLVEILQEPRDLPNVFAECRELVASLVEV